jgi:hypothetical protein
VLPREILLEMYLEIHQDHYRALPMEILLEMFLELY